MTYKKAFNKVIKSQNKRILMDARLLTGFTICTAIALLIFTKKGKKTTHWLIDLISGSLHQKKNHHTQLGNIIQNVNGHIKRNAAGLLVNE